MPEPYQPSSPEERSLLEEHIVMHSASEKISGHLRGTASAGSSDTMAFSKTGGSSVNNTPPITNRYSHSIELLPLSSPLSAAFPARSHRQASDKPVVTPTIASGLGNPSPTSSARPGLFSGSISNDSHPHPHPHPHMQAQSYFDSSLSRQSSHHHFYRPYHKLSSQHRAREVNPYTYVDMHCHPSQYLSHQQIKIQPSEAYIHSNHMEIDWNLSNELPQYARHPYPATTPGQSHISPLSVPRGRTARSATHIASPAADTPTRGLTAEEKEMRRKVSHSAIEKRRRERTNAVLRSLQDMIPGLSKSGKIQKLEILEAAAEHILQLKAQTDSSVKSTTNNSRLKRSGSKRLEYQQPEDNYNYKHYSAHRPQYDKSNTHTGSTEVQRPGSAMVFAHPLQEPNTELTNIASPISVTSDATQDGSGEDTLANLGDISDSSDATPLASDPSSMKVNFLLC